MACMVDGCNFLLNAVRHEAFQFENGLMKFVDLPTAGVRLQAVFKQLLCR